MWVSISHLAVCCLSALRNVSGWNSSDKSKVSFSERPLSAFSTQAPIAMALVTSPRRYCNGSSGPFHLESQLIGDYIENRVHDHCIFEYFLLTFAGSIFHMTSK